MESTSSFPTWYRFSFGPVLKTQSLLLCESCSTRSMEFAFVNWFTWHVFKLTWMSIDVWVSITKSHWVQITTGFSLISSKADVLCIHLKKCYLWWLALIQLSNKQSEWLIKRTFQSINLKCLTTRIADWISNSILVSIFLSWIGKIHLNWCN